MDEQELARIEQRLEDNWMLDHDEGVRLVATVAALRARLAAAEADTQSLAQARDKFFEKMRLAERERDEARAIIIRIDGQLRGEWSPMDRYVDPEQLVAELIHKLADEKAKAERREKAAAFANEKVTEYVNLWRQETARANSAESERDALGSALCEAEEQLAAHAQTVTAYQEQLERLQWNGYKGPRVCESCHRTESLGHHPTCWTYRLLTAAALALLPPGMVAEAGGEA